MAEISDLEWQSQIGDYVDDLVATTEASGRYGGSAFDADARTFRLFGTSEEPPATVSALMAEAPGLVALEWEVVSHTLDELIEAAATVDLIPGELDSLGVRLVDGEPGLVASTTSYPGSEGRARALAHVRELKVPIRVVRIAHAGEPLDGRGAGSAPFSGGSRLELWNGNNGNVCSSGFRVYKGDNAKMITAAHCTGTLTDPGGNSGWDAELAGDEANVGSTGTSIVRSKDAQLIDDSTYTHKIWKGNIPDSFLSAFSTQSGSGSFSIDEWVCFSGGWSGVDCGQVFDLSANFEICAENDPTDCYTNLNAVGVQETDGTALQGEGDSGGPAYQLVSGETRMSGIISWGTDLQTNCEGYEQFDQTPASDENRRCYVKVFFSAWPRFKDEFSPSLTLSPS